MPNDILMEYKSRVDILKLLKDNLEKETKDALSSLEHIDRISFRVKDPEQFVRKIEDHKKDKKPYKYPLIEIEDQVAGRVLVFFRYDIRCVLNTLSRTFNKVEHTYKKPSRDQEFGYETQHIIYLIPPPLKPPGWNEKKNMPKTFELQVRTLFMHAYAEPEHNLQYKNKDELPSKIKKSLAWIAASAWGADNVYLTLISWKKERKRKKKTSDGKK
jgi:putative GTP pyrophosphokinase